MGNLAKRCQVLVLFADTDVIFQAGYQKLKAGFKRAADSGTRVLFSGEASLWPTSLQSFYRARKQSRGSEAAHPFLNSGQFLGKVDDIRLLLNHAVSRGGAS